MSQIFSVQAVRSSTRFVREKLRGFDLIFALVRTEMNPRTLQLRCLFMSFLSLGSRLAASLSEPLMRWVMLDKHLNTVIDFGHIQRKFSWKTSKFHDCMLWLAFAPSCRPHHHASHIIMSAAHHQVVGKCEFTGENSLARETLCFLRQCGSWGRRSRVSVSAVPRLDLAKLPTKSAQDPSESGLHFKC